MTDVHSVLEFDGKNNFPLYLKYEGQTDIQPAYISLDLRTGAIDADSDGNIGGGCSPEVWNNVVLHFPVSGYTHATDLLDTITRFLPEFQKLANEIPVIHDGCKYIGKIDESTQHEIESLKYRIGEYQGEREYFVSDIGEYLDGNIYPASDETIESFANDVLETSGTDGNYLEPDMTKESIVDYLMNEYIHDLDACPINVLNEILSMDEYESWHNDVLETLKDRMA